MYEWNKIALAGKWKKNATGRYEYYFCSRPVKDKQHEFAITNAVWPYRKFAAITRTKVDPSVLADWEMELAGARFNGELDRGSMNLGRVRDRLRRHVDKCDNLLFVTTRGVQRVTNILEIGDEVSGILCVATLEEVIANPWGRIWRTPDGHLLTIEKPGE